MKYQSEIVNEILEKRGHEKSSLHYQSECIETWINEAKGSYPKLTEYEAEWLNYINENPIGEFPYVTLTDVTEATVDNVVPYAYKSAILKGQTLVNLFDVSTSDRIDSTVTVLVDVNKVTVEGKWYTSFRMNLKPSTKYTLFIEYETEGRIAVISNYTNANSNVLLNPGVKSAGSKGIYTFTSNDTGSMNGLLLYPSNGNAVYKNIMVIEGDYTQEDIPYFTGMQSVKLPVLTTSNQRFTILPYEIFENSIASNYQGFTKIDFQLTLTDVMCYIKLNNDMKIKLFIDGFEELNNHSGISKGVEYSKKLNSISYIAFYNWGDISFGSGKETILSMLKNGELEIIFSKDGEKKYPHYSNNTKTNILTVNEDVELGSVGEVEDELNSLTGQLTQRTETRAYQEGDESNSEVLTDMTNTRYKLPKEVVKTVDLNVEDQDGNTLSKIKPIEGTMNLSTDGETIKPTFTGEIPVEAITQNLASFIEE